MRRERDGVHNLYQGDTGVHPRVVEQVSEDLRDLYRGAGDPIAVLLQTMETEEFRSVVPEELARQVRSQLEAVDFEHEDDFVAKVAKIAMPVLEIVKRGKEDSYKQEGRDMYTPEDVEATVDAIRTSGAKKIYVAGNVGSGKTTFSRELARELDYTNIDLDKWFQIYRNETGKETTSVKEVLEFVLSKEDPPFVINHADLLQGDLITDANVVVFLAPKKEEQLRSRDLREQSGAGGEWQSVAVEDYDSIAEENAQKFEGLGGSIVYENEQSGTNVRRLVDAKA